MIVPCDLKDLDALRKISVATFAETFKDDNSVENMENYLQTAFHPDKLREELLNDQSQFYFAYDQDELAGYLKVNLGGHHLKIAPQNSLEVERIYVLQQYQKAGHGKRLMDKAMEIAEQHKKSHIWLGVWEENKQATSFYKRLGFQKTGHHYFQLGDEKQKDYILTLSITNKENP